jgi:hypothetical protein
MGFAPKVVQEKRRQRNRTETRDMSQQITLSRDEMLVACLVGTARWLGRKRSLRLVPEAHQFELPEHCPRCGGPIGFVFDASGPSSAEADDWNEHAHYWCEDEACGFESASPALWPEKKGISWREFRCGEPRARLLEPLAPAGAAEELQALAVERGWSWQELVEMAQRYGVIESLPAMREMDYEALRGALQRFDPVA